MRCSRYERAQLAPARRRNEQRTVLGHRVHAADDVLRGRGESELSRVASGWGRVDLLLAHQPDYLSLPPSAAELLLRVLGSAGTRSLLGRDLRSRRFVRRHPAPPVPLVTGSGR